MRPSRPLGLAATAVPLTLGHDRRPSKFRVARTSASVRVGGCGYGRQPGNVLNSGLIHLAIYVQKQAIAGYTGL